MVTSPFRVILKDSLWLEQPKWDHPVHIHIGGLWIPNKETGWVSSDTSPVLILSEQTQFQKDKKIAVCGPCVDVYHKVSYMLQIMD